MHSPTWYMRFRCLAQRVVSPASLFRKAAFFGLFQNKNEEITAAVTFHTKILCFVEQQNQCRTIDGTIDSLQQGELI